MFKKSNKLQHNAKTKSAFPSIYTHCTKHVPQYANTKPDNAKPDNEFIHLCLNTHPVYASANNLKTEYNDPAAFIDPILSKIPTISETEYQTCLNSRFKDISVVFHLVNYDYNNLNSKQSEINANLLKIIKTLNSEFNDSYVSKINNSNNLNKDNIKNYLTKFDKIFGKKSVNFLNQIDLTANLDSGIKFNKTTAYLKIYDNKTLDFDTNFANIMKLINFSSNSYDYKLDLNTNSTTKSTTKSASISAANLDDINNRINIIIINKFSDILGMSSFPWDELVNKPTFYITSRVLLEQTEYIKTVVHELSHCFGLLHIFETSYGIESNNKGALEYNKSNTNDTSYDYCVDTLNYYNINAKSFMFKDFFNNQNYNQTNMTKYEFANYMDYQYSSNMLYFTNNQMFRMKYFLKNHFKFD